MAFLVVMCYSCDGHNVIVSFLGCGITFTWITTIKLCKEKHIHPVTVRLCDTFLTLGLQQHLC